MALCHMGTRVIANESGDAPLVRTTVVDPEPQNRRATERTIAACALERRESRGAHRRVEYPEGDPELEHRHIAVGAEEKLTWETWE